jgi:predicted nucleotidyltransferase
MNYAFGDKMTLEYLITTLQANRTILRGEYCVKSLKVFGSYASNLQTEDSDIDFLVDFTPEVSDIFEAKYCLREYLQSLFHKEIDLARSKYLKPYVRNEIVKSARYAI